MTTILEFERKQGTYSDSHIKAKLPPKRKKSELGEQSIE
jgi:hypothetical protein